jgi:hypothetical protein
LAILSCRYAEPPLAGSFIAFNFSCACRAGGRRQYDSERLGVCAGAALSRVPTGHVGERAVLRIARHAHLVHLRLGSLWLHVENLARLALLHAASLERLSRGLPGGGASC